MTTTLLEFMFNHPLGELAFHVLFIACFFGGLYCLGSFLAWIGDDRGNGKRRNLHIALAAAFLLALCMPPAKAADSTLAVGLEPYGTIRWVGMDNQTDLGAGVALTAGITKNLSLVAFAEGDSTSDPNFFDQIDRAGAGLRYTAWLGTRVSLDAGVAGAWDIQNSAFFLRLPLGANLYVYKSKNVSLGVRAQYAFDISGEGPNGTASGIGSVGPVASFSF